MKLLSWSSGISAENSDFDHYLHNVQLRIHRVPNYMICVRHRSRRGEACAGHTNHCSQHSCSCWAPGEPRMIHPLPTAPPCSLVPLDIHPFALPTSFVGDTSKRMPVPALELPKQSHSRPIFTLWDAHEAHKPLSCSSCTFPTGSKAA